MTGTPRDYPRVGGEKRPAEIDSVASLGSPPRGRGKAPLYPGSGSAPSDHPRVGGEKLYEQMEQGAGRGSPPRGRGKAKKPTMNRKPHRITPAWAGKSGFQAVPVLRQKDHPRVGGEKGHTYKKRKSRGGSPPRGRGKEQCHGTQRQLRGITPAWAGKSGSGSCYCLGFGDHPRVGGEKQRPEREQCSRIGSPPRGRGKACDDLDSFCCAGITPTKQEKSEPISDWRRVRIFRFLWVQQ